MEAPGVQSTDTIQAAWIGAMAALIGSVVGALLTVFSQSVISWWTRPKLVLEFDQSIDRAQTSWTGESPFDGFNLRVSVRNIGRRSALGTRVYIAGMHAVHASGLTHSLRDSRQVSWAGWSFEPRSVQRGITFYADFVRISKVTSGWQFTFSERMALDEDLESYKGTYRFDLLAVADDAEPARLKVDVDYNGDWHNVRAWKPEA